MSCARAALDRLAVIRACSVSVSSARRALDLLHGPHGVAERLLKQEE